jgi:hypothetical protein
MASQSLLLLFYEYELEHRPGCSDSLLSRTLLLNEVFIRTSTTLRLLLLFLLESMRRDVRILLVGDGPLFPILVSVPKLKMARRSSQRVLVKAPLSPRSSKRHSYPTLVPVLPTTHTPFFFLIHEHSYIPTGAAYRSRGDYIPRGDLRKRNHLHSGLRRQVSRANRVLPPFQ